MVAPVQYAAHVPCLTVLRKLDSGFRLHEICVSGTCSKTCTRNFEHHRDRTPLHISNSRSYLRDKHMYSFRNNEGRKGIDPRAQISPNNFFERSKTFFRSNLTVHTIVNSMQTVWNHGISPLHPGERYVTVQRRSRSRVSWTGSFRSRPRINPPPPPLEKGRTHLICSRNKLIVHILHRSGILLHSAWSAVVASGSCARAAIG